MNADKKGLEQYDNQIYYFILKRVKSQNSADDILQNVFLKALKNRNQLKEARKIEAWLYQIARNEIIDYHKRESKFIEKFREERINNLSELKNGREDVEPCCLDDFIKNLPPPYRESVELTYRKRLKQKEVAERLGISLSNVKARIRRAKQILKDNFQQCCQYEIDENGQLTGQSNCAKCNAIIK